MIRILPMVCLFLALAPGAPLRGQDAPVAPGDSLRFSPGPRGTFLLVEATADTLVVTRAASGETLRLERGSVTPLRPGRRDRASGFARGVRTGFLVGGGIGAFLGFASGDDPPGGFVSFSAEDKAMMGLVVLGGAGVVAGGLAGALNPGHTWRPVPASALDRPRAAVRVAPRDGGVALGAEIRF